MGQNRSQKATSSRKGSEYDAASKKSHFQSEVDISGSQLASEKRQRSFIIHSKEKSVKSKKSHSRNPSR